MLTAVIVTTEPGGANSLRAALHETGLIYSVGEWRPEPESHPRGGELIPDVAVLDLPHNPETYFSFAAHLRRLRPTLRIVACSGSQPDQGLLLKAMRCGVQEFLTKPLGTAALREALSQFADDRSSVGAGAAERLIVVAGSKGGVGTSTVTVNLGVQLAQVTRRRVALLDFARPLGHLSLLLDLQPRFSVRDAVENVDRLDGHFLSGVLTRHKTGLDILAGTAHAEEWHKLSISALEQVAQVSQGSFDFVIVDGGVQDPSEWAPILRAARAILLVAEASLLSLWTLERHLAAAASVGVDPTRLRIVINRWRRSDDEALEKVERKLQHPIYARLPNDYRQVNEAVTLGMPLAGNSSNPLLSRYRKLAAEVSGTSSADAERPGRLSGLFAARR